MEHEKIIVGLDIGTSKICIIVGKINADKKLQILGFGKAVSEGVVNNVVTNIEKTTTAIQKALKDAEATSGIHIQVVNAGIGGTHIKSALQHGSITRELFEEITIEDVSQLTNDMYKTVIPPGNQIIHVIAQDYAIDHQKGIRDPVGISGIKLTADFHMLMADQQAVNNLHKCVAKIDVKIDQIIFDPFSASLAVLNKEEKEAGVCLVDIGSATTKIVIYHKSIVSYTAILPFGGSLVTHDIQHGCMVMPYQAELLKKKFGIAMASMRYVNEVVVIPGFRNRNAKEISLVNLARIIEARMEEIVAYIHQEIIHTSFYDKLTAGIVLTGGGAQLQQLPLLFEKITGLATRIGIPNEYVQPGTTEYILQPMYATGIGLVLAGYQALDNRVYNDDYIPNSHRYTKKNKRSVDFFKKIIQKTKGLLLDDYDEKQDY